MISIRVRGLPELQALLADRTRITKPLNIAMNDIAEVIRDRAKELAPEDTGKLIKSIEVSKSGGSRFDVQASAPYAINVHYGRSPGSRMPPLAPIRAWAARHGIPQEAVYPIAKAIAQRGIPPNKFLIDAYQDVTGEINEIVRRLDRDIERSYGSGN